MVPPLNVTLFERLSSLVRPVNYKLILRPNLDTGVFSGNVKINIVLKQEKNFVNLHSNLLDISKVQVFRGDREIPVFKYIEVKQLEQILIEFSEPLSPGSYQIDIDFSGKLTKKIVGFYSSNLKNNKTMVASKFQPTYARQAFPCFDEPDFKATYDITLIKPQNYVALSNMNEISKTLDGDSASEAVTFATSVPMSTYLACFVICDFDFKETEINSNDMIAIPDYVSGATEHWGLITYRETSFLVDEDTASAQNKISVANTIAHELAHMWFGNLVTMKWWDEVWLNEGFASYMQVKSLNAIEPSWTMLDQFVVNTLHSVLVTDAKLSSHPIVQTVNTPDQITAIFDAISYNKGASILRMLEGFTGEENFRKGVSDYLKKHKFGNTITQDLLACLEPYFKMEYPELNLTYRWFVPVTYKTNKGVNEKIVWFDDKADSVTISEKDIRWLKLNNNQVGYYRVNYPLEMWQSLIEQLKSKSDQVRIDSTDNIGPGSLAERRVRARGGGRGAVRVGAQLTTYLPVEEDYVPWRTAASILISLSDRLSDPMKDKMQKYIQHLVSNIYAKQNWDMRNLSVIDRLLRTRILSLGTRAGLPAAEEKVRRIFMGWLNSHDSTEVEPIQTDLRDTVYFYGMKYSSQLEWDKLWQIYKNEGDAQEQAKLRSALAAPRDTEILKKYLSLAWDENNIRSQDYLTVLSAISSNPSGSALAWDHLRSNWTQLVDRFTLNSRILGGTVATITVMFDTEERLKEMEAFFEQYPEAGAGTAARARALETVHNNIVWAAARAPQIAAWLDTPHNLLV
ncbi:hypothetical protein MSG28_006268 [Choristoneura fumiferana]|uniref:Uncharacterized protein n=1 Tax=Choristoneura fumiferana TaxID=7141 RepID=A0ACC0JEB2_CHOFU|nr:hypothetical protein MSG28_006268 [Choristoneura fumiferana]